MLRRCSDGGWSTQSPSLASLLHPRAMQTLLLPGMTVGMTATVQMTVPSSPAEHSHRRPERNPPLPALGTRHRTHHGWAQASLLRTTRSGALMNPKLQVTKGVRRRPALMCSFPTRQHHPSGLPRSLPRTKRRSPWRPKSAVICPSFISLKTRSKVQLRTLTRKAFIPTLRPRILLWATRRRALKPWHQSRLLPRWPHRPWSGLMALMARCPKNI